MARVKYYDASEEAWKYADISAEDVSSLQPKAISDAGGYFTTDTVEGALQEIGATIDGLDAALEALL